MVNKLFNEGLMSRLKKIPDVGMYFITAIGFFFAEAYGNVYMIKNAREATEEVYNSTMLQSLSLDMSDAMLSVYSTLSVLLSIVLIVVIFECILRFSHNVLTRRFFVVCDKRSFCIYFRLALFYSNMILGVIGLLYFFTPTGDILTAIFAYAVPTLFIALAYDALRKQSIPRRNHYRMFDYAAKIYLSIYLVLGVITTLGFVLGKLWNSTSRLYTASVFVDFAIRAAMFIPYIFYGKKLKTESEKPEDNPLFMPKEEEQKEDIKPFGDLNF